MPRPWWLYHVVSFVLFVCNSSTTCISFAASSSRPPRLVQVPIPNDTTLFTNVTILHPNGLNRRSNKGYLVSTNLKFTVQKCKTKLTITSKQAEQHGCHMATNGGPFQNDGTSVGGVVIDFDIMSTDFSPNNVGFGITFNSNKSSYWILGGIANASEAKELGVQYYLTGFDWLVYQGQPTTTTSPNENRAPRTAIGVDKHGHLLLLVVDGCEECFHNKGFTLDELANLLSSHGAEYAISLDGGGSSTLVQDGHVLNVPTCLDIPISCQRPVATIVCLHDTGANLKLQ